jgi:hypothetical protein
MISGVLNGSRLAYVVVKQDGSVKREKHFWTKEGIKKKLVDEDAGYLVYFPRGHAIRVKSLSMLRHYRLHKEPRIIQLEGLNDPNSPLGKMFLSQDPQLRMASYHELEQMVIDLASARGKIAVKDLVPKTPDEERDEEDF